MYSITAGFSPTFNYTVDPRLLPLWNFSKKNLNAACRPSEHPTQQGGKCQRAWLGEIINCVCVRVYVFSSHSLWTSSSLDVPAGVTQEEGLTGFFIHLLPAVRASFFLARRIQSFLSLVDREVEFCNNDLNRSPLVGHFICFLAF